jgi:hypothetical protein
MIDFNKRVEQSGLVNPGETVIATSFLSPVGMAQPGMAAFGLVAYLISKARAKRRMKTIDGANPTAGLAAGAPNKTAMTIAATNQRIMMMSNKTLSGKPKALLASIPWADVAGAVVEPAGVQKRITITFRDATRIAFHAGRAMKVEALADAINQLSGARV